MRVEGDAVVIPVGPERYELYCEQPAETDEPDEPTQSGMLGKLRHKVKAMLRAAQDRQRSWELEEDA